MSLLDAVNIEERFAEEGIADEVMPRLRGERRDHRQLAGGGGRDGRKEPRRDAPAVGSAR